MKKTKLVLERDQIKVLTSNVLPRIVGGMIPDSNRCMTQVSRKEPEVNCEPNIFYP